MNVRWLICIDDTDNETSIGTGRLARKLAAHLLARRLLEEECSVTRHQLLVHPEIPYTSHNSSACIAAAGVPDAEPLLAAARDYLKANWHEGANPGLCVVRSDRVPSALLEIARRAQREVLTLAGFDHDIRDMDLMLWWGGETGQGRIGACSGAALRSTGEDGRFIGLRGIRDLEGPLTVREICARSGVDEVRLARGGVLDPEAIVDTRSWIRPSLIGGRAVCVVHEEGGQLVPAGSRSADDG